MIAELGCADGKPGGSLMLKKIDCVMIKVDDVEAAVRYYSDVFGLRVLWRDDTSVGLGLPDTDAEIVLHCDPDIPNQIEVYYLVDDVISAVRLLEQRGCHILNGLSDIPIGNPWEGPGARAR
jgi:lactoylglutathione lyase